MEYPMILSSYKMFDYCVKKYPKRTVYADMHIDHDDFYVVTRTGNFRLIRNRNEIWVTSSVFPLIERIR